MAKRILVVFPLILACLTLANVASAQLVQNTQGLRPFHNRALGPGLFNQGTGPQYNANPGPAGPGTLVIPQIMAVKRPLPRKPVQPVFDLSEVNMESDEVVLATGARIRELSYKIREARRARDNRAAMHHFQEMERARQSLLRHLREIAPVKKSLAPLPKNKNEVQETEATPAKKDEPILPIPRLPGTKKK